HPAPARRFSADAVAARRGLPVPAELAAPARPNRGGGCDQPTTSRLVEGVVGSPYHLTRSPCTASVSANLPRVEYQGYADCVCRDSPRRGERPGRPLADSILRASAAAGLRASAAAGGIAQNPPAQHGARPCMPHGNGDGGSRTRFGGEEPSARKITDLQVLQLAG